MLNILYMHGRSLAIKGDRLSNRAVCTCQICSHNFSPYLTWIHSWLIHYSTPQDKKSFQLIYPSSIFTCRYHVSNWVLEFEISRVPWVSEVWIARLISRSIWIRVGWRIKPSYYFRGQKQCIILKETFENRLQSRSFLCDCLNETPAKFVGIHGSGGGACTATTPMLCLGGMYDFASLTARGAVWSNKFLIGSIFVTFAFLYSSGGSRCNMILTRRSGKYMEATTTSCETSKTLLTPRFPTAMMKCLSIYDLLKPNPMEVILVSMVPR